MAPGVVDGDCHPANAQRDRRQKRVRVVEQLRATQRHQNIWHEPPREQKTHLPGRATPDSDCYRHYTCGGRKLAPRACELLPRRVEIVVPRVQMPRVEGCRESLVYMRTH